MADLSQIPTDELLRMLGGAKSPPPAPKPEKGGIVRNIGAGFTEALTGIPGMILNAVNPIPGMMNTPSNIRAIFGKDTKQEAARRLSDSSAAGDAVTKAINKGLGPLNPETVTANSFPERLARGAGAGLTGALVPTGGAVTVGKILANAALGVVSGAGAATGAEMAPEPYKPIAALAGGVIAPMAAVGGVNAVRSGVSAVRGVATGMGKEGPRMAAGRVLAEASGGSIPDMPEPPLPGMKPTVGQQMGNQGLLWLERSVEQRTPEGAAMAAESRSASNQAITEAINSLGDTSGPASETMLGRLESALKSAKAETAAKWKAVGIDESTPLPKPVLAGKVDEYVGSLTTANRKNIPKEILSTFEEIPAGNATLGEIQDWRAQIGDEMRAAFRGGYSNKGRILGGLETIIGDFLDEPSAATGQNYLTEAGRMDAYNTARGATREMKERFGFNQKGSPVQTAISNKEFGQSAESNAANLFIRPKTSAGAPEAFTSYLKAIGDDSKGLQAARDAFTQKFMEAVQGVPDVQGNATIKPAGVSKFVDNYRHIIDSKLFDPSQRKLIESIRDAANLTARTARAGSPGGSDTFAKLSGKNWAEALLGTGMTKGARIVGGTLGGLTGGPVGAGAGAYGAPKLMETMLSANKEAAMRLVTEALYDPKLAATLIKAATKANAEKVPLSLQAKIYSILLGKQAGENEKVNK
jgi:hypothetical protein